MIYNELKINIEFPVEFGCYHIHIWGKPHHFSQDQKETANIDMVEAQFHELCNHYLETYTLQLAILKQVHGNCTVDACERVNEFIEADSFYTTNDQMALAIKTADCIPVLFLNTRKMFIGSIHSGWRGLELQILKTTLDKTTHANQNIHDVKFIVGPHIHTDHYETNMEVYDKFSRDFSEPITGSEKRNLNLKKILEHQFQSLGIHKSQTTWLSHDTFKSNQFYSHRCSDQGRNFNVIFFKKYG